jgi:hypothetical protein
LTSGRVKLNKVIESKESFSERDAKKNKEVYGVNV